MSAEDLVNAYEANEVAADQQYGHCILHIAATVESVGKMFGAHIHVHAGSYRTLDLTTDNEQLAAALHPEQSLRFVCDGSAKAVEVYARDCRAE